MLLLFPMTGDLLLVTDALLLDVPLLVHLDTPLVERVVFTSEASGVIVDDWPTLALLTLLSLLVVLESLDQVFLFFLSLFESGEIVEVQSLGHSAVVHSIVVLLSFGL